MMRNTIDKWLSRGEAALSDGELLTLLLAEDANDEHAAVIVEELLREGDGSLHRVVGSDFARLRMVGGMGRNRAMRLKVAAELGRRIAVADMSYADTIASDGDVVRIMGPILAPLQHEECWAIYLASSGRVLDSVRISQGGIQATVVDCRLIVKRALELLAVQIVLVHNHPSGNTQPSAQDVELTERVASAARLFDIRLLDHIIIARGDHFSFRASGKL